MDYLIKHFRDTTNEELALELGISETTLHRYARRYELKKSKAFMRKIQREGVAACHYFQRLNHTFPPKGFQIPNSDAYRFKPGHKESAASKKKRIANSRITRNMTIAKERWRVKNGLPQQTKLKLVERHKSYWKEKHYLKDRGYMISECGNYAEWNDETKRSPRLESRSINFKFRQHG